MEFRVVVSDTPFLEHCLVVNFEKTCREALTSASRDRWNQPQRPESEDRGGHGWTVPCGWRQVGDCRVCGGGWVGTCLAINSTED